MLFKAMPGESPYPIDDASKAAWPNGSNLNRIG